MKKSLWILILISCDQISKLFARIYLADSPLEITNFFELLLAENAGIAFSIPFPSIFLIPFTVIMLVFLGKMLMQKLPRYESIAFILIFSGAAGNLIDRIYLGKVIDFFSFWNFPIFNLADSFISVGIIIYIWYELRKIIS